MRLNPDSLWMRDVPDKARLQIINDQDFPRREILQSLGLDRSPLAASFGVCAPEEVEKRLNLTRFLFGNSGCREWLTELMPATVLPKTGDGFLRFYNPALSHNEYWRQVRKLAEFVRADASVPTGLSSMVADLMREADALEGEERAMAEQISAKLTAITSLEGIITFHHVDHVQPGADGDKAKDQPFEFQVQWDKWLPESSAVIGRRMFSRALSLIDEKLPSWCYRWFARPIRDLVKYVVELRVRVKRQQALQAMAITRISEAILRDVAEALQNWLNSVQWEQRLCCSVSATVAFNYGDRGLQVQLVALRQHGQGRSWANSFVREIGMFSAKERELFKSAEKTFIRVCEGTDSLLLSQKLAARVEAKLPQAFGKWFKAGSRELDREYRWFAVENAYAMPQWANLVRRLEEHREAFGRLARLLSDVARAVDAVIKKGEELGVPVCVPKIEPGHVVSFRELYPTQLLFRLERGEAVPINGLPELNGRMIGLTGAHGGGKTETELSIAVNIFLAQSGMLVFARQFRFNVKRVLGLVFIANRGQGSTSEQLLVKIRNVLEVIERREGREVVVVLDELGTGTQESSGLDLGRDLLHTLSHRGISVVFSTQITSLAQYATANLDALCYQFDRKHQIRSGIGDGGMRDLRRQIGVDKYLTPTH